MAKIYALQGLSNTGKSSSLILLAELVKSNYPAAVVEVLSKRSKDKKVIIHPVKGMKIGIESQGDPGSRLPKSLQDFRNANCDIIFCACRTRGMTVTCINGMNPPDEVQFISKTGNHNGQQSANATMAAQLMQLAKL